MPVINDLAKGANNICLKRKIHGEVRIFPVTEHTHSFKIFALITDLFSRVIATLLAKLTGRDLVPGLAHLFLNIQLNRKAVTIPPRNVGRVKTRQGLGLHNDILKDFINRMTHVKLTVGVRRAVMKDKRGLARASIAHLLIQRHRLPLL